MSRTQIRRGVFETNSSSTHSLQITNNSQDTIYNDIISSIAERYGKDTGVFDSSEYISDGCLRISGFEIPDGDEEGDVYMIIKSPMAKIQYLGMLLEHTNNNYEVPSEIFEEFKNIVLEYVNSIGIDVKNIVVDTEYSLHWTDYFYNEKSILDYDNFFNAFKDIDRFREFITDILYSDKILVYRDVAYSPWRKPEITII